MEMLQIHNKNKINFYNKINKFKFNHNIKKMIMRKNNIFYHNK